MRKIDLYWMSNREWWEYVDHIRTIKDSAPPEAKESYARYLSQTEEYERYIDLLKYQRHEKARNNGSKLVKYVDEQVKIVDDEGEIFIGTVNDYFYPEDNEAGNESMVIDTVDGEILEFYAKDITSIEIID